jgi:hypothetical protein
LKCFYVTCRHNHFVLFSSHRCLVISTEKPRSSTCLILLTLSHILFLTSLPGICDSVSQVIKTVQHLASVQVLCDNKSLHSLSTSQKNEANPGVFSNSQERYSLVLVPCIEIVGMKLCIWYSN